MDILILGNGFDLAHKFNTRYADFLDYCKKKYSTTKTVGVNDSKNFLFENVWVKHFINKKMSGNKWIDLEKEIYNVIVNLSKLPYFKNSINSEKFEDTIFCVSKSNKKFNFDDVSKYFRKIDDLYYNDSFRILIKDFVYFLYDQLRDFTKEFEKYLISDVMPDVDKKGNEYKFSLNTTQPKEKNKEVFILNFNYTNTFEKLYANKNDNYIIKKPVYIHGKIGNNNNNMVLGTQSFSNENISAEFNVFKKHHQRHRYGTIESYQYLLNLVKIYQGQVSFHIIGHSLNDTDHNILRHILLANSNSIINIYYHNEEALVRMQNNIDLIIGEEEVMTKVRFIAQDDPNRGILIPQ